MSDYKGLTLTKVQVKEIAKNGWITLDEPTFVGYEFAYRGPNLSAEMCESNDQFCHHVNDDESIHGADFLIVAYRPIKLEDDDD
jgi:hypothetical protein